MPAQTIGVIGLGIMGSAVSANLLKDGFHVIGYDLLIERVRGVRGPRRPGRHFGARHRGRGACHDLAVAQRPCARGRRLE
jgi:NAD binding domain of 6-phosphogluconate dehydrogenase